MKLSTKIGIGFGSLVVLSAVLGFFGWRGVNEVREHMDVYATWGEIDMVMNIGAFLGPLICGWLRIHYGYHYGFGAAGVGMVVGLVGRLQRRRKVPAPARPVEGLLVWLYLLGVLALLVYLGQADFVMDRLRPAFEEARSADRYQGALTAIWPVLWIFRGCRFSGSLPSF